MSNADIHGYNTPDRTIDFIRHTVALYPPKKVSDVIKFPDFSVLRIAVFPSRRSTKPVGKGRV